MGDFAFGAPWQGVGLEKGIGRAYVVYGGRTLPTRAFDADVGTSVLPGFVLEGHRPVSGVGMAGDVGDIDGDGRQDLVILASTKSELEQELSPSSISILFRASFDATTFTLDAIDPPGVGWLVGGDRVRLRGRGFDAGVTVLFGGAASPEVRIIHSALIEAVTPPSDSEGLVDVEVRQGAERASIEGAFRYRRRVFPELLLDREALRAAGLRTADIRGLGVHAEVADLNVDGRSDLVVSWRYGEGRSVHILFGRELWPESIDEPDVTIRDEPAVEAFAVHFDVSADVDGDGFGDLVMGGRDRNAPSPFQAPGRTYLLRGYGGSWPRAIELLEAIEEERALSFSGPPCANTKPVFLRLPGGETRIATGQTFCRGANAMVSLYRPLDFELQPALLGAIRGVPDDTLGPFGTGVAAVGDMNADGWPDFIAGHAGAYGAAYLILGDSQLLEHGMTVDVLDLVASRRAVRFTDGAYQSYFASNVEPAGDFSGDGIPDVIISATDGGFQLQGRSYVVFGSPELGASVLDLDLSRDGTTHMRITGEQSFDLAGYGQGIGDINADGYSDVAILGWYPNSERQKAHIVLGGLTPPPAIDLITLNERGFEVQAPEGVKMENGDGRGNTNVSIVGGDFDGDGKQDLAIPYFSELGDGLLVVFGPIVSSPSSFVRGDANADGSVNLADAVFVLSFLFAGAQRVPCQDAADSDDDGTLSITDGVYLLNYLFSPGSPEPPAPFPEAGEDPSPDLLGCVGA